MGLRLFVQSCPAEYTETRQFQPEPIAFFIKLKGFTWTKGFLLQISSRRFTISCKSFLGRTPACVSVLLIFRSPSHQPKWISVVPFARGKVVTYASIRGG